MRVIDIILKDLRIILSDKKAVALLIIMPLILISILGSALGGSFMDTGSNSKINVAIVKKYDVEYESDSFSEILKGNIFNDYVNGEDLKDINTLVDEFNIDKIFTEDFLGNNNIKNILNYGILKEEDAYKKLENGEVSVVVILPKNFIYDSYMNFFTPFRNEMNIEVIANQDKYISSQIVEGIMKGFSDSLSSIVIGKNVYLETAMEEGLGVKAISDMGSIIENISNDNSDRNIDISYRKINGKDPISSFQYYAVAMTAMFILFAASHGGVSLLEEKDNSTYQRMSMAGIPKWSIVSGKFFMIFLLGLIQIGIIVIATSLAFNVNWGSPLLVVIISLCTAFSVAGLGTMLAAITYKSNNYKVAHVFQGVFIHVMSALGGSFVPIDVFPETLRNLSNLTINGLALKSYQRIMLGGSISQILSFLITLVVMGILFTGISVYILKGKGVKANVRHNKTATSEA